ncbi:chromosome partitioning protein [Flavobacterium sediminis]|uniref:Chromosome partitioning protein n=1 Tax=Flavobacterium sediminis TaxID=2201181 RepID=A0A2U8QR42_9FLAO|nr:AAA family ATPase [Flavobacterium sediminis]AWM12570.1 chromosome partitioning protein [Flavobacterium sediminis]
MKILTFYNHKGGVSKTSTTFNVAHLLAEKGKKVLVVDADPQCNITELLIGDLIAEYDEKMESTGKENEIPGTTLLNILSPRISGDIPEVDISKIENVKVKEKLFLIRGDVQLSSIEDALSESHQQRFSTKIHEKRTYVAIGDFLTRYGLKNSFDYIFIDVGPSSGSLTRSCFLSCDCFFVPVAPDRFNIQAIKTLSLIIDRWIGEHDKVVSDFKALGLPVKEGKPKFLGTIPQHYKLLKGKPKPGYKLWMDRLPKTVIDNLFPILKKYSTQTNDLTNGLNEDTISTPSIPDFQSLAPLMQEFCVPVYAVKQSMTASITEKGGQWGGGTWDDATRRMSEFKSMFEKIIDRIN